MKSIIIVAVVLVCISTNHRVLLSMMLHNTFRSVSCTGSTCTTKSRSGNAVNTIRRARLFRAPLIARQICDPAKSTRLWVFLFTFHNHVIFKTNRLVSRALVHCAILFISCILTFHVLRSSQWFKKILFLKILRNVRKANCSFVYYLPINYKYHIHFTSCWDICNH